MPPHKGEFDSFIVWQKHQLKKYGVNIHTNTALTIDIVKAEKADEVVIAAGAEPIVPNIPGHDKPIVTTAKEVLAGKVFVGPQAVVIGGGMVGAETACHLAFHGKKVTIIEMLP